MSFMTVANPFHPSEMDMSMSMQVSGIQLNDPNISNGLIRRTSSVGSSTPSNSYSSSSEAEAEPVLKYVRISNDVVKIIQKSKVTAVAVNDRFLMIGTQNGHVHQFDHNGYEVTSQRKFPVHPVAVTALSIDESGEYYASCSNDGRINIFGFFSAEFDVAECLPYKVETICLDPNFAVSRSFVTGGEKPSFWEKVFFKYRRTDLTRVHGSVSTIAWHKYFIAYALPNRVQIYDIRQRYNFESIEKSDTSLRNDLYPCHLCWKSDDSVLIIGWGKTFSVYRIFESSLTDTRGVADKRLELHQCIHLEDFICGVAPYNEKVHKYYVIMCYPDQIESDSGGYGSETGDGSQSEFEDIPSFVLIEPTQLDDYEIVNEKLMKLTNYKDCFAADYKIASVYQENIYIVYNGSDLILAIPTTLVDRLNWLFDNGHLEEAIQEAQNRRSELKEDLFRQFGLRYLDILFKQEEFEKAAKNCKEILGKNSQDWEQFIHGFIKKDQLKILSLYIPTSEPQLKCEYYELILLIFLKKDQEQFLQLVNKWPAQIYNPTIIMNEVADQLDKLKKDDRDNVGVEQLKNPSSRESQIFRTLQQALAILYQHIGDYGAALKIYLHGGAILGSPALGANMNSSTGATNFVFEIIEKRKLYSDMTAEVEALMDFDKAKSLELFVNHTEEMPVKHCVDCLRRSKNQKAKRYLFDYLDLLYSKDPNLCRGYEDLLVELFAEYEPKKLLGFLKEDPEIDFPKAFEVCKSKHLTKEMIHIMKRTGDHSRALQAINESDILTVEDAIAYCKDVDEQFLWDQLIESSKDNPKYISGLLNNIGTHVDPIKIIQKIKLGLEIPGLRDSLVKILQDYNLQRNLTEGCSNILVKDCFDLMTRMINSQRRGQLISSSRYCLICHRVLLPDQQSALAQLSTTTHISAVTPAGSSSMSPGGTSPSGTGGVLGTGGGGGITTFNCSHCFHSDCLAIQQQSGGLRGTGTSGGGQMSSPIMGGRDGAMGGSGSGMPLGRRATLAKLNSLNQFSVADNFFCPQCDPSR